MTRKPTDAPGPGHWTSIVERILNGNRERTIGKRFFGVASALVFITATFHTANVAFLARLTIVVAAEAAVGLLAILMIKLERGSSHRPPKT